jgi:endo-1,4-beta-xylanase
MKPTFFLISVLYLISTTLYSQNVPIIIQAETGTLGSDFDVLTSCDVSYIAPHTNLINSTNPGSTDKVSSYIIFFTDSGTYKLFVRLSVGKGFITSKYK